ncbi:MAG: hypothetical protein JRI25_08410 [Deltaproteobacteria bacterium]|nr:hypothetical protein [Deltaproteobacteria bacterium]
MHEDTPTTDLAARDFAQPPPEATPAWASGEDLDPSNAEGPDAALVQVDPSQGPDSGNAEASPDQAQDHEQGENAPVHSVVPTAGAVKPVFFKLTYPDPVKGKGDPMIAEVYFSEYRKARAEVDAFLDRTRQVELRHEGGMGEEKEREILSEIKAWAYPMLSAAHAIYDSDSIEASGKAPEDTPLEKAQQEIVLDRLQRRMERRSSDYFAFLENVELVPHQLQSENGRSVDDQRNDMFAVIKNAEQQLGLRGELKMDLSSSDGGTGEHRAARLARLFERDAEVILAEVARKIRHFKPIINGKLVTLVELDDKPTTSTERLAGLAKRCVVLLGDLEKAESAAGTCVYKPGPINDVLAVYGKAKTDVRHLMAEATEEGARAESEADDWIAGAEVVLDAAIFAGEVAMSVIAGPLAGDVFGAILEATKTLSLEPSKFLENLIADVVSRFASAILKGGLKAARTMGVEKVLRDKFGDALTKDMVEKATKLTVGEALIEETAAATISDIAKETVHGLADDLSLKEAVTKAVASATKPKNLAMNGLKSMISVSVDSAK